MLTTSETVLLITIWVLTSSGVFFGLRAKLRRRKRPTRHHDQERP